MPDPVVIELVSDDVDSFTDTASDIKNDSCNFPRYEMKL